MRLGIALDGEGRLGRPAAVTALARAADRLDYGSVWCLGPWAAALAGAVAAVTDRVQVGIEPVAADDALRAVVDGHRLVVDELVRGPLASPGTASGDRTTRRVLFEVDTDAAAAARADLLDADGRGVTDVVVLLVGDPDVDAALAAYAVLGELAEGSAPAV